jgi:uncharacterized damage-inducible protein DinB
MNEREFDELLNWLAETPEILKRSVQGLSDAQLRERPGVDEFSLVEQICHLRDIEMDGYLLRIGRILNEDHPQLPDLDGSRLAIERGYWSQDPIASLAEFTTVRTANVNRLRVTTPEQRERSGELEGTGNVTLARLAQMMREHDTVHRGEVAAMIAHYGGITPAAEKGAVA